MAMAMVQKSKSLAVLGLDGTQSGLPDDAKQEALFYPDELRTSDLGSLPVRELYNMHVGDDASNQQFGHESSATMSFMTPRTGTHMTSRTTSFRMGDAEEKGAASSSNNGGAFAADKSYYQLVFDIKHCIFKAGSPTVLLFSIFDHSDNKFVTEEYCLHLSENNFPTVGSPEDCKVLFKNLSSALLSHDLYITCCIYRVGPMEAPDVVNNNNKNNDKKRSQADKNKMQVTRPYAVTVIRLKEHVAGLMANLGQEFTFEPSTAPICCPREESQFVALIFDLIQNKKTTHYLAPLSIGMAHSLTLYGGDEEVVEHSYAHYDQLTVVETLSIDPAFHSDRHVLYVTIHDLHVNQRNKRAACNVCVKMQLRENAPPYRALPGCMLLGKGKMAMPSSETTSPVYYHNNDPIINQRYTVLIPSSIETLADCHLYFTLWHMPATNKKPDERGFAFLKLYQDNIRQLTGNNEYELNIYRHDKKSVASYLETGGGAAVGSGASTPGNDSSSALLKSENKSIRIHLKLSSTRIYSNIDIHQFLTWRQHESVDTVIAAVKRVRSQQFVNLLTILDAFMRNLFEIMLSTENEALLEQTFATLVGVLGDLNKNTETQYKPRIEDWIAHHFEFASVWRILAVQTSRLLQWITSSEAVEYQDKNADALLKKRSHEMIRQLQNTMKGVKYLFHIMRRSSEIEIANCRSNSDEPEAQRISQEYHRSMSSLFQLLNRVMSLKQPKTVAGVQSFALRNFLDLLDSLPNQNSGELALMAERFISAIHNDGKQISIEKLVLIRRTLQHAKLERAHLVQILLPSLYNILNYHLDKTLDERVCCATILAKCVDLLDPTRPHLVLKPVTTTAATTTTGGDADVAADDEGYRYTGVFAITADEIAAVTPSDDVYDKFVVLMLKTMGVLEEVRRSDLSELMQKIFGKQLEKNKKVQQRNQLSATTVVSEDQLAVHRDLLIAIADLSRILTTATTTQQTEDDDDDDEEEMNGGDGGGGGKLAVHEWGSKCDRIDKAIATLRSEDEGMAVHVVECALKCCNNLIASSLFPSSWLTLRLAEAEVAMRCLSWFGWTLQRNYLGDTFDKGRVLWKEWLGVGMLFLSNEDFALEDYVDSASLALLRQHYGDVRTIAIRKLTVAWTALTPHRAALADTMISAAVEASASEVLDIQEFAIDVYFQMIRSEFSASSHIQSVETHTIDQIDQLTAKHSHKENVINRYLDFFRKRVREKLASSGDAQLTKIGNTFISDIERLYHFLVQLKKLPNSAQYEDERTAATLKLLSYLNDSRKNELYNRYIHHLALMHQSCSNHVEAGICFKSHGDRLGWSDRQLKKEPLVGLEATPEWKRHVSLLELAMKHFMLGEAWEMAVGVCQELAKAYQEEIFDLKALSSSLDKQSHLWKMIGGQDRVFHSVYLVRFIGDFKQLTSAEQQQQQPQQSSSSSSEKEDLTKEDLSNNAFIYKSGNGKQTETVRDFTDRMKRKYPNVRVVNSADKVERKHDDESVIQITTLTPSSMEELDGDTFKWDQAKYQKAPLRLRKYYRENETGVYFYTNAVQKKKHKKDNEFRSLWITKTFLVCEDSIPSMRRRIPVLSQKVKEYTPFQTAINQIVDKNNDMLKIIERLEGDPTKSTNDISMNLNGILDAAVMGGVAKYREAFFDGTYLSEFPHETKQVPKFVDTLKQQMIIAKNGLESYEKYAVDALQPHIDHLRTCYKKQTFALSEFYKEVQKYSQ